MISDTKLLKLWRDPSFNGSFRGARTFQVLLKTDLNIDVPLRRLYKVLAKDQIYLIHQKVHNIFPRRHYIVHNYGELCQMDIAHMFTEEGTKFKYFLLLVDVYSSKIFTEPLRTREASEIVKALNTINKKFNATIYVIQADKEAAFRSKQCKQFFQKAKILFRPKFGKHKGKLWHLKHQGDSANPHSIKYFSTPTLKSCACIF